MLRPDALSFAALFALIWAASCPITAAQNDAGEGDDLGIEYEIEPEVDPGPGVAVAIIEEETLGPELDELEVPSIEGLDFDREDPGASIPTTQPAPPNPVQDPVQNPVQDLRQGIGTLGLVDFCALSRSPAAHGLLAYFIHDDAVEKGREPIEAFVPCQELAGSGSASGFGAGQGGFTTLIRLDLIRLESLDQAQQAVENTRQRLSHLPAIALGDVAGAIVPLGQANLLAKGLIVAEGGPLIIIEMLPAIRADSPPFITLTGFLPQGSQVRILTRHAGPDPSLSLAYLYGLFTTALIRVAAHP